MIWLKKSCWSLRDGYESKKNEKVGITNFFWRIAFNKGLYNIYFSEFNKRDLFLLYSWDLSGLNCNCVLHFYKRLIKICEIVSETLAYKFQKLSSCRSSIASPSILGSTTPSMMKILSWGSLQEQIRFPVRDSLYLNVLLMSSYGIREIDYHFPLISATLKLTKSKSNSCRNNLIPLLQQTPSFLKRGKYKWKWDQTRDKKNQRNPRKIN